MLCWYNFILYSFHACSSIQGINSAKSSAKICILLKSFPPDGHRSCCLRFTRASDDIERGERVRPVFQLANRTGIQRPKCKRDYITWVERKLFEFHWISNVVQFHGYLFRTFKCLNIKRRVLGITNKVALFHFIIFLCRWTGPNWLLGAKMAPLSLGLIPKAKFSFKWRDIRS